MQREITITILAEDIHKNSYFYADKCPITRALHRAGYNGLRDSGFIMGKLDDEEVDIDSNNNEDYRDMLQKLFSMYNTKEGANDHTHGIGEPATPIPIEDFDVTIRF
jgi:hypothetical protein